MGKSGRVARIGCMRVKSICFSTSNAGSQGKYADKK